MKKEFRLFLSLTTSLVIMFIFCIVGWSYEFDIRDSYRFLRDMPLSFMNTFNCFIIIILALLFILIDYNRKQKILKRSFIIFVLSFSFVTITAIKNFIYYSEEIRILNKRYTEKIDIEDYRRFLEDGTSAVIYIYAGEWEEEENAFSLVRNYAYSEQTKVYFIFSQEMSAKELLNNFQITLPPGIVFIEGGEIVQTMNYYEICTWLSNYKTCHITY
ncbi:MAG: hypothetical protein HFG46_15070 [Clostridium sp.]|nr:hypothetical protein [Clostridium sp.]